METRRRIYYKAFFGGRKKGLLLCIGARLFSTRLFFTEEQKKKKEFFLTRGNAHTHTHIHIYTYTHTHFDTNCKFSNRVEKEKQRVTAAFVEFLHTVGGKHPLALLGGSTFFFSSGFVDPTSVDGSRPYDRSIRRTASVTTFSYDPTLVSSSCLTFSTNFTTRASRWCFPFSVEELVAKIR